MKKELCKSCAFIRWNFLISFFGSFSRLVCNWLHIIWIKSLFNTIHFFFSHGGRLRQIINHSEVFVCLTHTQDHISWTNKNDMTQDWEKGPNRQTLSYENHSLRFWTCIKMSIFLPLSLRREVVCWSDCCLSGCLPFAVFTQLQFPSPAGVKFLFVLSVCKQVSWSGEKGTVQFCGQFKAFVTLWVSSR